MASSRTMMVRKAVKSSSGRRSLPAELLHALNQPLTGLQCSMEVALAVARTPEQYVRFVGEGLELTERMRVLVGALREVMEIEESPAGEEESILLAALLHELLGGLDPVAEAKEVRLVRNLAAASGRAVRIKASRVRLTASSFRVFESTLALAGMGTEMRVLLSGTDEDVTLRIDWSGSDMRREYSRSELGLIVAEAGFQRLGATWERFATAAGDTLTITLPGISATNPEGSQI